MTSPTCRYDVVHPSRGTSFWWASCDVCGDTDQFRFAPHLGVTSSRAETAASAWARDHRCGQTPTARERLRRDEYVSDNVAGDLEDGAA